MFLQYICQSYQSRYMNGYCWCWCYHHWFSVGFLTGYWVFGCSSLSSSGKMRNRDIAYFSSIFSTVHFSKSQQWSQNPSISDTATPGKSSLNSSWHDAVRSKSWSVFSRCSCFWMSLWSSPWPRLDAWTPSSTRAHAVPGALSQYLTVFWLVTVQKVALILDKPQICYNPHLVGQVIDHNSVDGIE